MSTDQMMYSEEKAHSKGNPADQYPKPPVPKRHPDWQATAFVVLASEEVNCISDAAIPVTGSRDTL